MKKKFLSLALALVMLLSLAACGGDNNPPATDGNKNPDTPPTEDNNTGTPAEPEGFQPMTYDEEEVYTKAFSEFEAAYAKAKEATDVNEMYALQAIAEAKMLESGVMLPYYSDGGNYGISRIVPRTAPTVMWGSDLDRWETLLVTNEIIKPDDRAQFTAMWGELAGTGTYEQAAKDKLAELGYTLKDTRDMLYEQDPETWDVLSRWTNTTSEPICLTVDGLAKYDMENVLQPALAESWECSEDGLTWTFHIREGVAWVDSQGRKVDEVKADDWVASMQHNMDFAGASAAEVFAAFIVNGEDYYLKNISDFTQVGVEAPDDRTLVYHLTQPVPAFESLLSYCGMFAPLCRSYYESQGGTFGPDHDNGNYGTGPNNIAYCGPYLITSWTEKNSFVFDQNPTYWNPDSMNIKKINWYYYDGSDPLRGYNDTMAGTIDSAGLGTSALQKAREDGNFDKYAYLSTDLTGNSRCGFYNLNRQAFATFADPTIGISPQSHESVDGIDLIGGVVTSDIEDDAARTHLAINNQNFRLALTMALDRGNYHAQRVGDELKELSLRNTWVPGNFVTLNADTTVDISGTATTFPAGTYYGEIVQAQITADGYPMKVWDPAAADGLGSGDGYDGWYNPTAAKEYLAKAVEELAAQGMEITKENPIQIDYYTCSIVETWNNQANVYKQVIESNLDGLVQVNIVDTPDTTSYQNTSYFNDTGADNCTDVNIGSGWNADYADPASYLDIMQRYAYLTKNFGLWGE